ncbi:flagellar basal body-associated protein FliL [Scandinavium sp.]|uniref:flagellar basal body-associated protein FliL n=1 Tax=Scandinavium sp. TaxID=2830653 RepID=UPI0028A10248|nr:flagellar basal body-associated protein FliL [Scandinavium sp.]
MTKKNQKAAAGGKKNSLLVILLMFVAIAACGLASYTFYEMKSLQSNVAGNKQNDNNNNRKSADNETPLYVPMETFTVSLQPDGDDQDRVIYIGLTLRVKDEHSKTLAEKYLPEVRSRIFILLAHQAAKELSTEVGKKQLIDKIKEVISKPVASHQSIYVNDVLFNAFILR